MSYKNYKQIYLGIEPTASGLAARKNRGSLDQQVREL